MRVSVITFPGSNCDHDAYEAFATRGHQANLIWHKDHDLQHPDVVILPGGFSYGDYLRCGALARFSPIVKEVIDFAHRGGLVMGICNGFQILTESGLLPGALLMNAHLKFI
ncbi:MAG TPA: phosphoribosylformylglycinamidine synthase subunit PurQ, partial [Candidatus Cloacimonadota bacterium]|nr:phosphoribosylformylglycinamidine synthase subunit PurQ [Candidatus Cloacimonadota bacterium]